MYYTKNGKIYRGKTHKMPNGSTHTGAKHTKNSRILTTKKPKRKK